MLFLAKTPSSSEISSLQIFLNRTLSAEVRLTADGETSAPKASA